MTTKQRTDADVLRELMARYNERRTQWIVQYGTADGFDAWFTQQVLRA